jgi:hypothetical protein
MAAAAAWLRAEAEGQVQTGKGGDRRRKDQSEKFALIADPRSHFAKLFAVNEKYVEMARDLLLDDPVGVEAVRGGTKDLRAVHLALESRLDREKTNFKRLRELERKRPDLAERVRAEELELDEA